MNFFKVKVICPVCGSDDMYTDIYTINYYGNDEIRKECKCNKCSSKGELDFD